MKWLVADSLSCPEQYDFSHLDSYGHYLLEAGEHVRRYEFTRPNHRLLTDLEFDVAFVLDRYDSALSIRATKRIAQVAAICNPMPWEVRKPDGSPAYDLVISSIPWMVDEARKHGCRAEFQKLCFDHRALVCSMGVEKDIDCLFVGTVDGNHRKRAEVLRELGDLVTIAPPTYGRDFYRLVARAKTTVNVHAEWAKGARNALRIYETIGLGGICLTDGLTNGVPGWELGSPAPSVAEALERFGDWASEEQGWVLANHTYVQRVPQIISWARSL